MKIFASCVIKNEGDIIEECLRSASKWADRIFVFDNGSTDDTWEKVQALQSDIVVPWKQDGKVFQESRRSEPFNAFRREASPGDWWCRLDADEFYIDNPRDFLSRIPRWQHVVWGIAVEYYLTHGDLEQLNFSAPIAEILQSLRYYRAENSEQRFFRYRPGMIWNEAEGWPRHIGIPATERIRYKHYKYRSPQQTQLRLDTRRESQARGYHILSHQTATKWEDEIADTADLDYDNQDGQYRIRHDRLPNHLDPLPRALLKRVMHGLRLWA